MKLTIHKALCVLLRFILLFFNIFKFKINNVIIGAINTGNSIAAKYTSFDGNLFVNPK
jgi:hypothetical protein